jgi:hemerythrin-like domain-containing protein
VLDAIALLTSDHETVRELLSQLEETTDRGTKKRMDLLQKLGVEIRVHARIEEEIFYPAYKAATKSKEDAKLFFEAAEEHGLVDIVLPALEDTDPTTEPFGAKAKVLKDLIEHHAEEEESEMFPKAKKLLGKERLKELGAEMEARKEELTAELSERGTSKRSGRTNRESTGKRDTSPRSSSFGGSRGMAKSMAATEESDAGEADDE